VTGTVIQGSRNIFIVRGEDGIEYECRLKGKVLVSAEKLYNALAPGDVVEFTPITNTNEKERRDRDVPGNFTFNR
jgi:translation initiation factor IF-1